MRAAAIDTGALEGLYDVDRGFTLSVAGKTGDWEAALQRKGSRAVRFIEAQIKAYDYVTELAAQETPLTEASIRALHTELCASQETHTVLTPVGWQEQPLPRGEYKRHPNHVMTPAGALHAYAPVHSTPMEMERLCNELRGELFESAHPILQAAYAHYALVVVHPFADGNGRVARALGSVFTYRAAAVPLMIFSEQRDEYLIALRFADEGDRQPFVSFVQERGLDAIRLVEAGVIAAAAPSLETTLESWTALQRTRGGFTHVEVDAAGHRLFQLFCDALEAEVRPLRARSTPPEVILEKGRQLRDPDTSRIPAGDQPNVIGFGFRTSLPVNVTVHRTFQILIPVNPTGEDDLLIADRDGGPVFGARMAELMPRATAVLEARAQMRAKAIVAETLHQLRIETEKRLGRQ